MDDPTKDGYSIDNLSQISKFPQNVPPTDQNDQNGVHGTSGIANNAFVLMVQGGTNRTSGMTVDPSTGLGMGKALKIMYRAETTYYTPSTDFRQAAQAAVKAATDLYGSDSPEVKTTTAAWTAVGCLPAQPPGRS
jgi:Zn-dependent metalloprotease